jgi:eukaryotic-like serine/threonine-protein kinase
MSNTRESLLATLASAGQTVTDLGNVGATILRPKRPSTLPELPLLSLGVQNQAGADFIPGDELGRGGMGVVQLAKQSSLGRDVAIKTARSTDESVKHALVREARLMGALEHPNVVPVHTLGVDDEGAPILVMKRVEGTSWRELLLDEKHPGWAPLMVGHSDRLRANVEVLTQVCRALAFAHDRGIVHRDLKPDNVMIGRFGEVYLLDWGIAMKLSEREHEPEGIVGTPGYLAPEMAHGVPANIDARADVYLLGATLFEILSGHAPHDAQDVTAALLSAVSGLVPPLPASAPADLAALVRSAMEPDRERRLATAELFREGLARFLISRQAEVLASDARAALKRAEQAVAAEGATSASAYRSLVEARFGFTSAQRMRPHDESLRGELEKVTLQLAERELALRSPSAARALLAELARVPPELTTRLEALEAEVTTERSAAGELKKSREQADSSAVAQPIWFIVGPIMLLGIVFGTYWTLQPAGKEVSTEKNVFADLLILGVLGLVLFVFRRKVFATAASTQITLAGALWGSGVIFTDMISSLTNSNVAQTVLYSMVAGLIGAALVTALALRDLWPCILVQLGVVVGILFAPGSAPYFGAAASTFNALVFVRAVQQHAKRTRSGSV